MNVNLIYQWTIYSAPYALPKGGVENLLAEKKGDVNQDGARTIDDVKARFAMRCIWRNLTLQSSGAPIWMAMGRLL